MIRSILNRTNVGRVLLLAISGPICLIGSATAMEPASSNGGYRLPPKAIADLIDAQVTPAVSVGPNGKKILVMHRPALAPISEVAQPELRLAGIRINPRTNARARRSYYTSLDIKSISGDSQRRVSGLPSEARIQNVRWSPDGRRIGFTLTKRNGVELWAADVDTGKAKRLTGAVLNTVYGSAFHWVSDSRTLICRVIPSQRGAAPKAPEVPVGPTISENLGGKAPARTYQDLLTNAHDEALFTHYLHARAARVTVDGRITEIGSAGIVTRAEPSPDGRFVFVETVHRPFSYLVPVSRFPKRAEIWDSKGNVVRLVADLPLAEKIPIGFGAVATGPRSFGWRSDVPATLHWTEAQDGGDPRQEATERDRVYVLDAPFRGDPVALVSVDLRFAGITWGHDKLALVSAWWWKTRNARTWIVDPSAPGSEPTLLIDRSFEDRYNDPGRPMQHRTRRGTRVL
ncbi:MAG: S9 family peptidase, partial [Planctomycetes bacterium]|nr:S9 family peptidase [Planctomycetota bacterium]